MNKKSLLPKKILLFTDWFSPAYKAGGPIRSCVNFVVNMHEDFELYVFTGDTDLAETVALPGIRTDSWQNYQGMARVYYSSPATRTYSGIQKIIRSIRPEYIYINSFFSKYSTIYPLIISRLDTSKTKLVLSPRGMLKPSALQFKSGKKKIFLTLTKLIGLYNKVIFHATDQEEVKDIRHHFSKNQTLLASNFPGKVGDKPLAVKKEPGELKILFVGRIHPIKNLDYLLKILSTANGTIQCTIIGPKEQEQYWTSCMELINRLPASITINFLGEVPYEEVGHIIQGIHIFALPTQGENFGHAIFDALSKGKPVLVSDQTPWRNLQEQQAGWDLALKEPGLFSNALQDAVNWNQQTYEQWSVGAHKVAKNFVNQSNLSEQYKKIFS